MTKKNLSDLLREEAGTPPPQSADSSPAAQAKPATSRSARRPTKADLEQQVTELTTALAAATTREQDLQTQLTGLQADLASQQERLFELKDRLEQAAATTQEKEAALAKATAELAEAKQVILKMTAAPVAPAPPSPVAPPPVAPAPAAVPPAAPPAETRAPLSVRMASPMRRGAARGIPEYAIQRGDKPQVKNTMLSDEDIGWVD
ncbi:MAG: hypothetical protein VKJ09_06565 [Leptolyngbya sp.]|nr:hypothetical protein [Leptolyngbya sp.]